ncbi:MAG TPA: alpha-amylase family glycosyl hydrolase, partial [Actinomycetes bacterium]|nr:alpha-amylase family glycosyl hydrolase [Actinomycetes bacterium]
MVGGPPSGAGSRQTYQSRSGRDDPKRDWYVWRDPAPYGGPPTNWIGYAGQSAWCWDEATGQYYYRFFLDAQPDL